MHVLGQQLALAGLDARTADELDVLAELGDQLEPALLEALERLGAVRLDRLERRLGEREELLVLRDGLGLAADGDDRADVAGDGGEHLALGRRAAGLLACGRHALLAQEPLGRLDVAAGLLERALGVHHPGAGAVAELLDEAC